MRSYLGSLLGCLLLICAGCARSTPLTSGKAPPSSTPVASGSAAAPDNGTPATGSAPLVEPSTNTVDACALLTSKDLQAVQGEALKETRPSTRADGGFLISQCFYALPTPANSISLLVAQKGESAGARDPREFWQETFHRTDEEELEKERAKAKDDDRSRAKDNSSNKDGTQGRQDEEVRATPQKIVDVGDEAYWTGNRVGGALYALKGNIYIRVSVGGPGDQAAKIKKAKALALIVLKHF